MNQYIKNQLSFLSEQLGIDVFLDDKQQAIILIDGVYPISIRLIDSVWRFYAMVCYASDIADSNSGYKKILSTNMNEQEYGGGGGLCLDESANAILYILNPTCNEHSEDLYNKLNGFVNRVDVIREMVL
ncbi:hypothetical protein [Hafnia alvei]|uniref:Uncharacterized protein n=1 Tax=Hafnia alvei TaxID=569 RepID=A0A1C6YV09_HAFAL|nr:hypothetical protein [Hafnia alvei]NLS55337.1 hypothetical protein [Hafnia alvei]SCM50691.1 hypothetical protein BN1044_00139 [Hafnia alvei]